MRILIAADMEGVTGVVVGDQTDDKHPEYARFRRLMTGDVNAAVRGALEAGAEEVIVSDGHGNNQNILIEELNPRARLNTGSPRPFSMVQGVELGVEAALFVGYHARAGAEDAILSHTWSGRLAGVRLNGQEVGETGLNAAVCGHFGVPVLMVSGDQTVCAEAAQLLGPVETVVVKRARGRLSAECLPPEVSQQLIQEAAARAVRRSRSGSIPRSPCRSGGTTCRWPNWAPCCRGHGESARRRSRSPWRTCRPHTAPSGRRYWCRPGRLTALPGGCYTGFGPTGCG